jgi:hypothetical protein
MTVTYEAIVSETLGSAQSSVTIGSGGTIPQTYTDLVLVYNGEVTATGKDVRFRFNGDTGNNYSYTHMTGNGSTATSGRLANNNFLPCYIAVGTSTEPATILINMNNYSNTTTNKTVLVRNADAPSEVVALVGLWRNTGAITSITIFPNTDNFAAGSSFSLYGIKAE